MWGGIHPTSNPEESIRHTDIISIGEGEETLLELVQKMEKGQDFYDIKGLWFNKGEQVIKNKLREPFADLDRLPFFDFSMKEHYILDHATDSIAPLDVERFKKILPRLPHPDNKLKIAYRTMTDRGCPHKCSYCNISNQKEMYDEMGAKYLITLIDCFSKFVELVPTVDASAKSAAQALVSVFGRYGCPCYLCSDRGGPIYHICYFGASLSFRH